MAAIRPSITRASGPQVCSVCSSSWDREIALAVVAILMARNGVQPASRITPSLLYTRHNCAIP